MADNNERRWRIVEVATDDVRADDLSDSELVGISILLTHLCGEPRDEEYNVYWRARNKIQYAVEVALAVEEA